MELSELARQLSQDIIYNTHIERTGIGKYVVSGVPTNYLEYVLSEFPEISEKAAIAIAAAVERDVEAYIDGFLRVGAKPIRFGQSVQDIYNLALQLKNTAASPDDLFDKVSDQIGTTLDQTYLPLITAVFNWQPGQDDTDISNALQAIGIPPGTFAPASTATAPELGTPTPELGTIPAMPGYTYGPEGGGPGVPSVTALLKKAQDDFDDEDFEDSDETEVPTEIPGYWEEYHEPSPEIFEEVREQFPEEKEVEEGEGEDELLELQEQSLEDIETTTRPLLGLDDVDIVLRGIERTLAGSYRHLMFEAVDYINKLMNVTPSEEYTSRYVQASSVLYTALLYGDEAPDILLEYFPAAFTKASDIIDYVQKLAPYKEGLKKGLLDYIYNEFTGENRLYYTPEDIEERLNEYKNRLELSIYEAPESIDEKVANLRERLERTNERTLDFVDKKVNQFLEDRIVLPSSREEELLSAAPLHIPDVSFSEDLPLWLTSIKRLLGYMPLNSINDLIHLLGEDAFENLEKELEALPSNVKTVEQTPLGEKEKIEDLYREVEERKQEWLKATGTAKQIAEAAYDAAREKLRTCLIGIYEDFYHNVVLTVAGLPGMPDVHRHFRNWVNYFRGAESFTSWGPAFDLLWQWASYGKKSNNNIDILPEELREIDLQIRKHLAEHPSKPFDVSLISKYIEVHIPEGEEYRKIKMYNPLYVKYVMTPYEEEDINAPLEGTTRYYDVWGQYMEGVVPNVSLNVKETPSIIEVTPEMLKGEPTERATTEVEHVPAIAEFQEVKEDIRRKLSEIKRALTYEYSDPTASPYGEISPLEFYRNSLETVIDLQDDLNSAWKGLAVDNIEQLPGFEYLAKSLQEAYDKTSTELQSLITALQGTDVGEGEDRRHIPGLIDKAQEAQQPREEQPGIEISIEDLVSVIEGGRKVYQELVQRADNLTDDSDARELLSIIESELSSFTGKVNALAPQLFGTFPDRAQEIKDAVSQARVLRESYQFLEDKVRSYISEGSDELVAKRFEGVFSDLYNLVEKYKDYANDVNANLDSLSEERPVELLSEIEFRMKELGAAMQAAKEQNVDPVKAEDNNRLLADAINTYYRLRGLREEVINATTPTSLLDRFESVATGLERYVDRIQEEITANLNRQQVRNLIKVIQATTNSYASSINSLTEQLKDVSGTEKDKVLSIYNRAKEAYNRLNGIRKELSERLVGSPLSNLEQEVDKLDSFLNDIKEKAREAETREDKVSLIKEINDRMPEFVNALNNLKNQLLPILKGEDLIYCKDLYGDARTLVTAISSIGKDLKGQL